MAHGSVRHAAFHSTQPLLVQPMAFTSRNPCSCSLKQPNAVRYKQKIFVRRSLMATSDVDGPGPSGRSSEASCVGHVLQSRHVVKSSWQHPSQHLHKRLVKQRDTVAATSHSATSSTDGANISKILSKPKLLAGVVLVLLFGVANRVLYKMALVPMGDYVFFLAQLQNIGYLLVYFITLAVRYRAGHVTRAMLAIDKRPLLAIGACEAAAQLLFMMSASHLPGQLLPVLNQSFLVWNLAFAALIMHTRYTCSQLVGALMILLGVIIAAAPPSFTASLWSAATGSNTSSSLAAAGTCAAASSSPVQLVYVVVCVSCFAFPALASIIKDVMFRKARKQLGRPLDIFVVNSFGSLYQSLFVLLLLPAMSSLYHVPLSGLPDYLVRGAQCFRGHTPVCGGSDCSGAPLLPVLYVVFNLAFNVSMLLLLRTVGSVTATIVGSCLVPLTILAFTLPLPYLAPAHISANFTAGAGLLMAGLLVYNYHVVRPMLRSAVQRQQALSSMSSMDGGDSSVDLPTP